MKRNQVYVNLDLSGYEFEQLPKGDMFAVSINPYAGYVFLGFEKHRSSYRIAYDVLKEVMHACEILERGGSENPLSDYVRYTETGVLVEELVKAARKNIRVISERGERAESAAEQSGMVAQKVS